MRSPLSIQFRQDAWCIIVLCVIGLLHRLATAENVTFWSDTTGYWTSARQISEGLPYSTAFHRASRLGLILPLSFFQWTFGASVGLYYAFAIGVSLAQSVTTYALARQFASPLTALGAGLFFFAWPLEDFDGSRVTADGMAGLWISLSFLFVIRSSRSASPRGAALVAGIFLGLGYLSKISSLLFIPGLIATTALLATASRARTFFALGLGALTVLVFEHAIQGLLTGKFSNSFVLTNLSYGRSGKLQELSLLEFLTRPLDLPPAWLIVIGAGVFLGVLLGARKAGRSDPVLGLGLSALGFVGIAFYLPRSLFPLIPAVLIRERYLSAALPLLSAFIVVAAVGEWRRRGNDSGLPGWAPKTLIGLLIAGLATVSLLELPRGLRAISDSRALAHDVYERWRGGDLLYAREDDHRDSGRILATTASLLFPGDAPIPEVRRETGLTYLALFPEVEASGRCVLLHGSANLALRAGFSRSDHSDCPAFPKEKTPRTGL